MLIILLASACISLLSAPVFSADESIARLTKFTGTVMIKSKGAWGIKPEKNLPLYSGDKLVTRIGTATITFNDGAVMDLRGNSNLMISEREEEEGVRKKVKVVKRRLRLLLGKLLFRTGRAKVKTSLETPTAVCGIRGTAGTLSIDAGGQSYIHFTEGGVSYTVGEFIKGVAGPVPDGLADLHPVQRAARVAYMAAQHAAQAADLAASGDITEADAALAGAQAAEAAALEARAAAKAMENHPDPMIQGMARQAVRAAELAIDAARNAQRDAINKGANPMKQPQSYIPPEGETGFNVHGGTPYIPPEVGGDTTPPDISITSMPDDVTKQTEAIFQFTANEPVTWSYSHKKLGAGVEGEFVQYDPVPLQSNSLTLTGLSEGNHQVVVVATDGAGNVSTTSYVWTIDRTNPVVSISAAPGLIDNTSSFVFQVTDANPDVLEYRLDGGDWTPTGLTLNLGLPTGGSYEGPHTVEVRAKDAAGNEGPVVSHPWTYDTIPPGDPAVISQAASPSYLVFTLSSTDANDVTYEGIFWKLWRAQGSLYVRSAIGNAGPEGTVNIPNPGGGTYRITLNGNVTDAAGNTSTVSETVMGPFDLNHYALTGSVVGFGSVMTGTAQGNVSAVADPTWTGGWSNRLTIDSDHTNGPWQMVAAGQTSDSLGHNGYWFETITNTEISTDPDGAGSSTLTYLTDTTLGKGTADLTVDFNGVTEYEGTLTEEFLFFSGDWGSGPGTLYYFNFNSNNIASAGEDDGLVGLKIINSETFYLYALGEYTDDGSSVGYGGYVWNSPIDGNQFSSGTAGHGGFQGYTGGSWTSASPGTMDGHATAVFWSDGWTAGLLFGPVQGVFVPMSEEGGIIHGAWMAEGMVKAVVMATGLDPSSVSVSTSSVNFYGSGGFGAEGSSPYIYVENSLGEAANIDGQDWGVWKSVLGGTYSGSTSDYWLLSLSNSAPGPMGGVDRWAQVVGSPQSGGKMDADVAGAWVDLDNASTGVMGGKLKGVFNPAHSTWLAAAMGSFIETNKFLDMIRDNKLEALQALNIPCIEVGRAHLTGTGGYYGGGLNVNMWDTTFFRYSTGVAPRIWASGNVTGQDTSGAGSLHENWAVPLTGSSSNANLEANFTMKNFSGNTGDKWNASVQFNPGSTVGPQGGSPEDKHDVGGSVGGAVGKIGTGGNFSGTAAGVARPQVQGPR